MLDVRLFGLDAGRHLLENALFHALNAGLLFVLLWRVSESVWPSAIVAALFSLHPLHVESVAWVAERKDVLSAFFWLMAAHAYVSWVRDHTRRSYVLVTLFFLLATMSKPMAVTFPAVLLLFDYWPLCRLTPQTIRRLILEKIPWVAIAALATLLTIMAQLPHAIAPTAAVPIGLRLSNAPVAYATYLAKTLCPVHLAVFYPYPSRVPIAAVLTSVLLLALISGVAVRVRHSRPYLLVGWCWFLVTLLPVIGLIQVGAQALADRYSYLPLVGCS